MFANYICYISVRYIEAYTKKRHLKQRERWKKSAASAQACKMPLDTYLPFSASLQCRLARAPRHITRLSNPLAPKLGHSSKALLIKSTRKPFSASKMPESKTSPGRGHHVISPAGRSRRRRRPHASRSVDTAPANSWNPRTPRRAENTPLSTDRPPLRHTSPQACCHCVTDTWRRRGAASAASLPTCPVYDEEKGARESFYKRTASCRFAEITKCLQSVRILLAVACCATRRPAETFLCVLGRERRWSCAGSLEMPRKKKKFPPGLWKALLFRSSYRSTAESRAIQWARKARQAATSMQLDPQSRDHTSPALLSICSRFGTQRTVLFQ